MFLDFLGKQVFWGLAGVFGPALVAFAGFKYFENTEGLTSHGLWWLAVAIVAYFTILVVVTPAAMDYRAQNEIRSHRSTIEKIAVPPLVVSDFLSCCQCSIARLEYLASFGGQRHDRLKREIMSLGYDEAAYSAAIQKTARLTETYIDNGNTYLRIRPVCLDPIRRLLAERGVD